VETDGEADIGYGAVGGPQQGGGAFEATGEEVGVGGVAEGTAKLAAEVGAGEASGAGEVVDVERLEVAGVGEVLGAE
jgi:hypothetical protein